MGSFDDAANNRPIASWIASTPGTITRGCVNNRAASLWRAGETVPNGSSTNHPPRSGKTSSNVPINGGIGSVPAHISGWRPATAQAASRQDTIRCRRRFIIRLGSNRSLFGVGEIVQRGGFNKFRRATQALAALFAPEQCHDIEYTRSLGRSSQREAKRVNEFSRFTCQQLGESTEFLFRPFLGEFYLGDFLELRGQQPQVAIDPGRVNCFRTPLASYSNSSLK